MDGYKYVVEIIKDEKVVGLYLYNSLLDFVLNNADLIEMRYGEYKWTGFYINREVVENLVRLSGRENLQEVVLVK